MIDNLKSTVESFTISPWSCLCNWFKSTERLGWSQDDQKFTTYSVKVTLWFHAASLDPAGNTKRIFYRILKSKLKAPVKTTKFHKLRIIRNRTETMFFRELFLLIIKRTNNLHLKSMNISSSEDKNKEGKTYLPNGVDGVGVATRKYLEAHGAETQLPQSDRRKLEDNRLIMKAYLISKLVAARYSFEDGHMEFEQQAEERKIEIEDYKERTQAMYDLLYSGQIMVDTRATRRQQRVALKRLRKSNLNLRPSKIRELAKQMKEEAEKDRCSLETGSSGIGSTCDISKAETTTVAESNRTGISRFSRFLAKMGIRSSRDSAMGSSLGSVDRLGGVAVIEVPENHNWTKTQRAQPLHTYGGAQF